MTQKQQAAQWDKHSKTKANLVLPNVLRLNTNSLMMTLVLLVLHQKAPPTKEDTVQELLLFYLLSNLL